MAGGAWYVKNFASYSATYGAIAAVIVLLLYFFISAAITLLGAAEINNEIYQRASKGESGNGEGDKQKTV